METQAIASEFFYHSESRRMAIGEPHPDFGREFARELHCGECFQLRVGSQWHDVRIEHSSGCGWYLIGLPPQMGSRATDYEGCEARMYP